MTDANQGGESDSRETVGIKSVGIACKILEVVARARGPISLKSISKGAGVTPSKAYRYAMTLRNYGLLSQTARSGQYDLGQNALRIGLAAVNRIDVINYAGDSLEGLAAKLEADCFLTVWSDLGPTVVRFYRSSNPCVAMVGPGMAFPLLASATGMVFLAYGDEALTAHALERELELSRQTHDGQTSLEAISQVRAQGYAYTRGTFFHGRQCVAAPILSINDKIIAAVTIVTTDPEAADPQGKYLKQLVDFCRQHSIPKKGYLEENCVEQAIAS